MVAIIRVASILQTREVTSDRCGAVCVTISYSTKLAVLTIKQCRKTGSVTLKTSIRARQNKTTGSISMRDSKR